MVGSVSVAALVVACSAGVSDSADAQQLAAQACSVTAESPQTGFDPQTERIEELSVLADAASTKSQLAEQAAEADERWMVLSEASAAISAFAQVLLDARIEGEQTDQAISPAMWEQYKTASNAFLAECQFALASEPAS